MMESLVPIVLLSTALLLPVVLFWLLKSRAQLSTLVSAAIAIVVGWVLNFAWASAAHESIDIVTRFGWACPAALVLLTWLTMRFVGRRAASGVRHMNRTGIALAGIYFILTCICLAFAFIATDAKGQFVLLQVPIALQLSALDALGFHDLLRRLSWPLAYLVLALPSLIGLYCVGWVLALPFRHSRAST